MLTNAPARPVGITPATPRLTVALTRSLGVLFLLQFGVFAVTLVVLGGAIDWPASLDAPPTAMLPLLVAQRGAVTLGYSCYLVSALLLIPIALLARRMAPPGAQLPAIAATLGVLAGLCKTFGILRRLTAIPALAELYGDPASGQATRDAVAVVYIALNHYAGGIGELLGVDLFAGLWTVLVALAIVRRDSAALPLPAWLGWFGLFAGASLLSGTVGIGGLDLGGLALTISGVLWQLWMIAMGLLLSFHRAT